MTLNDLASGASLHPGAEIVYVMGATCSGKSTFLTFLRLHYGSEAEFVEVGKEFRRRYPPEHFQGQSNPTHTRNDAATLYLELTHAALLQGTRFVFVDGQPRTRDQVDLILASFPYHDKRFLLLDAPLEIREERAKKSRQGSNLELTQSRLTGDLIGNCEVLTELLARHQTVHIIDTTRSLDDYGPKALDLLEDRTDDPQHAANR